MDEPIVIAIAVAAGAVSMLVAFARTAWRKSSGRRSAVWLPVLVPLLMVLAFLALMINLAYFQVVSERVLDEALGLALVFLIGFVGMLAVLSVCYLVWWGAWWSRIRITQRIVIGQIAAVIRQNLPMATALALAAESERGHERTILQRISSLLAQGLPLSDAVRVGYPNCPGLVLSLIVAGERADQLPGALEQAECHLTEQARRRERVDASIWPYIFLVLLTMGFIVSGIMIAVVPKYKDIFRDFNTRLPGATIALIDISEWFVVGTPPGWVLLLPMLVAVPVGFYLNLRPRRTPDPAWPSRWADWVRWHTPGLRQLQFGQGMSLVLQTLRMALRSGMSLDQAARLAADIDVNTHLRPRIRRFAELLGGGTNLREAAVQARLGGVAEIALASGQRSRDMDAALRYVADYHDAVVSRWWIVVSNLAWPLTTLVMGTMVAFVIVSLFLPLVALINSVMG